MRNRYTFDTYHSANTSQKSGSPTNSYENVISDQIMASQAEGNNKSNQIFVDTPFASYKGHTSDLLDVSWSKVFVNTNLNNLCISYGLPITDNN